MKNNSITLGRLWRISIVIMAMLLWLGSVYRVEATPPEPETKPSTTSEPGVDQVLRVSEINKEISLSPLIPAAVPSGQSDRLFTKGQLIQLLATNGHWTGTTNRGQPVSFDVLSGGNRWDNFKLRAPLSNCNLYSAVEYTLLGPGPINGNQFGGSNSAGTFSFSGQFNSTTAASGTYAFVRFPIPGCSNFTQSGTWTASIFPPSDQLIAPKNLTALALSTMQILLQWQDENTNEFGFRIEQSLNGVNGWTEIATTPATSHAPAGLFCGTTYYYRVRAYNALVNSPYSNIASATTLPCPPIIAPSNLTATSISNTQINLTWRDNSNNETGFKIERSSNPPVNWIVLPAVGSNVTTYANNGLACGTTYSYRVLAYNATNNSTYSNVALATTAGCGSKVYLPIVLKSPLPPPTGSNHPPVFPNPFTLQTSTQFQYNSNGQLVGAVTTIIIQPAADPDSDPLSYIWTATNGNINGSGASATWNRVIEFGRVKSGDVTVVVQDGRGGSDSKIIKFQ